MRIVGFALALGASAPAYGYMGPGAGLALMGSLFALFAAVGIGAIGLVWYPLKRLLRLGRETEIHKDALQPDLSTRGCGNGGSCRSR